MNLFCFEIWDLRFRVQGLEQVPPLLGIYWIISTSHGLSFTPPVIPHCSSTIFSFSLSFISFGFIRKYAKFISCMEKKTRQDFFVFLFCFNCCAGLLS